MFKKLKEKLDETGLKNKLLDYASNANAGNGDASHRAQTASPSAASKGESSSQDSSSTSNSEQPGQEEVTEDWSVKGEPPPIGWSPPMATSPVGGAKVAVLPSDTESEADDINSSLEGISKEKLLTELKRWHARYQRAKDKYTQRTKSYQELNYEKEKLQTALSETQDRLLRRQAELREQCVLEQHAKAHLEQNLRVLLDEKDELIAVQESKIKFLKEEKGSFEPPTSLSEQNENVEELQKKVKRLEELLNRCRQTLNSNKEQSVQLKKQLEEKDADIKQALEQELKLREHLLHMEQQNNKECAECVNLKDIKNKIEANLAGLQEQLKQMEIDILAKENAHAIAIKTSKETQSQLEEQLRSCHQDYQEQLAKTKADLEVKEKEKCSTVQSFEETCISLQNEIKILEEKSLNYASELEKAKIFKEKDRERENVMKEIQTKCQSLELQLEEKQKELQLIEEKNVKDNNVTISELTARCNEMDNLLKEKVKEDDISRQTWHDRERELLISVQTWEEKYSAFESRFEQYEEKNMAMEDRSAGLERALQEAKEEAKEYVQKFEADYAENLKSLENYKAQLELSSEKRAGEDIEIIKTLNEKCDELEEQKKVLETECRQLGELLDSLKGPYEAAKQQLTDKEETYKQHQAFLEEKCHQFENIIKSSENERFELLKRFEEKCSELEESLQLKESDVVRLNEMLEGKHKELDMAFQDKERCLQSCQTLEMKCQSLIDQLGSIQNDSSQTIQELRKKCFDLQADLDKNSHSHSEVLSSSQEECSILQQKLSDKENECLKLNEENTEMAQTVKDFEVKCETLNQSILDKEKEKQENIEHLEASCQALKIQLHEQTEEGKTNLSRLSTEMKEIEELKTREIIQNYEEKCLAYEEQLKEIKENCTEQINVVEEQLSSFQNGLKAENDSFQEHQDFIEKQIKILKEQLKEREKTNETLKMTHMADIENFKTKCQEFDSLLKKKDENYNQAEETWQVKFKQVETTLNDKELQYAELIKIQEEKEKICEAQAVLIQSLETKCKEFDEGLQTVENSHSDKFKTLEEQSEQLKMEVKDNLLQFQKSLHEKDNQVEIHKEAEDKFFQKMQSLEELCHHFENQLNDSERNESELKAKCKNLEDSLLDQSKENNQKTTQLQEKCQRLEIQLKDIEEDSSQSIKVLEEKCCELQVTSQTRESLVETLEVECMSLKNKLKTVEIEHSEAILNLEKASQALEEQLTHEKQQMVESSDGNWKNKCELLEQQIEISDSNWKSKCEVLEQQIELSEDNWKSKFQILEEKLQEQEANSIAVFETLKEKVSETEKFLKEEQERGLNVFQRLIKAKQCIQKAENKSENNLPNNMVPSEWQEKAEMIIQELEQAFAYQEKLDSSIHPHLSALVDEELTQGVNQQQIKLLLQNLSRQLHEKDHIHQQELQQAIQKTDEIEKKFLREEESEVHQLAQQLAEQSAANEDMREHFLLQIQEKEAEILSLQKQFQGGAPVKKSDWDNAWDMEEDEMCNNTPVQSVVANELQAVMNDNNFLNSRADLDQLERFLNFPTLNSTTPKSSLEPTEFEYLRNVLLAYMSGREPMVMAKVIAAVLNFPEEDTQEILRREAARTSLS